MDQPNQRICSPDLQSDPRSLAFCPVLLPCLVALVAAGPLSAAEPAGGWWNPQWRFRTTVERPFPCRDAAPRPVEVALDLPLLLEKAGVKGQFDPASLRVVAGDASGPGRLVPFVLRSEFNARENRPQAYLTWIARPETGGAGRFDIYFDTKDRAIKKARFDADQIPSENLLANSSFESAAAGQPKGWTISPTPLFQLDRFAHTAGARSLKVVVDKDTPAEARREASISQKIDVRKYAGQEMLFECDLLAERAAYGAPVCIELEQYRADGSRISEYAVEPRWLTVELAQGQLVQFSQRGRFHPEAAEVNLRIRLRLTVRDEDTNRLVTGPESDFTVWLDRVVVRPGERWPWPGSSAAGYVEGALEHAPVNRAFEFTGQRRVAFNGASEGTLTSGRYDPDPRAYHWGLEAGTLEFWCRPKWNADDGREHIFYEGVSYGHRLQSRIRKLDRPRGNELEFSIADAGGKLHTVRGPAPLKAGQWHHLAATWSFPKAQVQLFVDGRRVGADGPHERPWPSSLVPDGKDTPGIGINEDDSRSIPMQAFLGGDAKCHADQGAEAALDEVRISDVARYTGPFTPSRKELPADEHTRALFHFENDSNGVHSTGDQFVRGHQANELEPYRETATLETFDAGRVTARRVAVRPHPPRELFEKNRVENRLVVTRPLAPPPDPRFTEYRVRQMERTVTANSDEFSLEVKGDFPPLMRWITYEPADPASGRQTLLAHWRANDNVVPFSTGDLARTVAPGARSDAEKAFQAFRYALATTNYYDAHYCETLSTQHRPRVSYTLTKALNIYPFDQCGPLNSMLRKLFLASGISSNDASGTHHQFEQAFYQGDLRLFDLSPRRCWLNRDDASVASRRDFENDLYLKLRQGIEPNSGLPGRVSRAGFGSAVRPHSMDFPLRPGERVSFSWHNEGRWFELTENRQPIPLAKIPPYFGNGAIVFEPIAGSPAMKTENLRIETGGKAGPVLRAADPNRPASLIYQVHCPYILSDGQVTGGYTDAGSSAVVLSISFDEGKTWRHIWRNESAGGAVKAGFRDLVMARYAYWLKLELAPGSHASASGLNVRTTFVASPLALPGRLSLGKNRIRLAGGPLTSPIKTECRWIERYKSDLGVSLNAISYYLNGDEAHRNLFVVRPGDKIPIRVAIEGRAFQGKVSLENLPEGWTADARAKTTKRSSATSSAAAFVVRPSSADEGDTKSLNLVLREAGQVRRVPVQVLVADAPLAREAEAADELAGTAAAVSVPEVSGARAVALHGEGRLSFDLRAAREGIYALWLRARWEPESSTRMDLAIDGGRIRPLRAEAMIGFTDWTDPRSAHTKMFAHFGEQYAHWSWYRIGDVRLTAGPHRLTLAADGEAWFDALVLVPQNPAMDRAAMNLFQNWNYAPWDNAF